MQIKAEVTLVFPQDTKTHFLHEDINSPISKKQISRAAVGPGIMSWFRDKFMRKTPWNECFL